LLKKGKFNLNFLSKNNKNSNIVSRRATLLQKSKERTYTLSRGNSIRLSYLDTNSKLNNIRLEITSLFGQNGNNTFENLLEDFAKRKKNTEDNKKILDKENNTFVG
jgi:hypothetical protein